MESDTTVGQFCPFSYGKGLPERLRNSSGKIPVYGSNGIVGWHDTPLTQGPTVIVGRKGTVGAVHLSLTACWPIDTTFFVEFADVREARFVYYLLKTLGLEHMNSDSAVPGLNRDAAHARSVRIPDSAYRAAIAGILGTLDDKIELNRRMNETLEGMARAIFKSWFVDFLPVRAKQPVCVHRTGRRARTQTGDPVRAKAAGQQPPGLAPHIADLFPDAFEASELGEIPKGWEVRGLSEIGTFLNGLALQKYPPNNEQSLPVIKIAQLRKGNTEGADQASAEIDPAYIVDDGDVIFSWSGSLECVLWTGGRGALNQHLFRVTSDFYPKWFYYFWIHHHLPWFRHIAAGKATTMGHIQRRHLAEAKVLVPATPTLLAMNRIMSPLVEAIIARSIESRTLAALRDTLLPKLISGELSVPDAEKFFMEVAL